MTARIDADTVRHARKHLANHGRRTDGFYFGIAQTGPVEADTTAAACPIGALAIAMGGIAEMVDAEEIVQSAFQRWSAVHDPDHNFSTFTWWNDEVADDATADQFMSWLEDHVEAGR